MAVASEARVTKITISSTTLAFNGRRLAPSGLTSRSGAPCGELDPLDPHNSVITDISLRRVRQRQGAIHGDLHAPQAGQHEQASGVMVYGVVTAGVVPLAFNVGVTAAKPAGDGFVQKPGNMYLWSGWQGDIAFNPALRAESIQVPVAPGVTGPTFARFVSVPGNAHAAVARRRPHSRQARDGEAKLISIARENNGGVRTGVIEIPRGDWSFGNCVDPCARQ